MPPALLIVSGLPATGKSTLARALARALGLPLVSKDDFKERLFDALERDLPEPHRALGPLSFELMWHTAGLLLEGGQSLLLETHFYRAQSVPHILGLLEHCGARGVQIFCHAPLEVLAERDRARVSSGRRHRAHGEGFDFTNLGPEAGTAPLELPIPLLELDTADLSRVDFEGALEFSRTALL